jgi:hypothetical protein
MERRTGISALPAILPKAITLSDLSKTLTKRKNSLQQGRNDSNNRQKNRILYKGTLDTARTPSAIAHPPNIKTISPSRRRPN